MKNQLGLITCLVLAVATALILLVESKRPIYVEISMDEIHKELCDAETESHNKEEKDDQEQTLQPPLQEDYDKEEEKGDLR